MDAFHWRHAKLSLFANYEIQQVFFFCLVCHFASNYYAIRKAQVKMKTDQQTINRKVEMISLSLYVSCEWIKSIDQTWMEKNDNDDDDDKWECSSDCVLVNAIVVGEWRNWRLAASIRLYLWFTRTPMLPIILQRTPLKNVNWSKVTVSKWSKTTNEICNDDREKKKLSNALQRVQHNF